ncbi:MAG: glycosyltransferase family 9 protein [Bacteroidales bacterium]|nr:glycosyltransferase family 9 protein [Bacteroidales bacterium]MDY0285655.1 glycosyltransferase family 9 protein [Bacteroidales bacterium]HPE86018.1 glycosyltransferase family 9 protein [Bacteroidales bacterium]
MAKILIIRFSSIGDIVLTTPVVRMLAKNGHDVYYLTKEKYREILIHNPYLSGIFILSDSLSRTLQQVRMENIDFVIDLHRNFRSFKVKVALRKPARSFHKLNFYKWLLVNLKLNFLPEKHIVDRYLDTASEFIAQRDDEGLNYFSGEERKALVDLSSILQSNKYVVLAVGGQHATKRLPLDKLLKVCDQLIFPVVLLGGHEDRETGEALTRLSVNQVTDLCGRLSLNESAEVIRYAAAVVSHDTGMMHIAAAYRKNIVSLWGSTVPAFGMYPYLPSQYRQRSVIIEALDVKCRPCSKLGFEKCPRLHFHCMEQLQPEEIVAAVKELVVGF